VAAAVGRRATPVQLGERAAGCCGPCHGRWSGQAGGGRRAADRRAVGRTCRRARWRRPAGGAGRGGGTWPLLQVLGTAACYVVGPVIPERKLAGADGLAVTATYLGLATIV
jgi:hypothetical protein